MPEMHPVPTRTADGLEVRTEYTWPDDAPAHNHQFLAPALARILGAAQDRTLIDLGCGNGSLTAELADRGFITYGLDVAAGGVRQAMKAHPNLAFSEHDLGMPLHHDVRDAFDVVISAEVIEHLLLPRELFRRADEAMTPDGRLIITTPYHGWLKNVALAVSNRMDEHWSPAQDLGRIKFFSKKTLTELAADCGFELIGFHRVGRIPPLASTMIAEFRRASS